MRGARDRHERAVRCDGRGWRDRRTRRKRTAKSCGSGAAVLALRLREAKLLRDNGGKRAVLREEHEVSRKAIAQGRPECSRCPVCSCALLFAQIARETAGAASTRSSLRPLIGGREADSKPRAISAARMLNCIHSSLRAQRSNPTIPALRRGLLRFARNDVERARPASFETPRSAWLLRMRSPHLPP
jgi:hypothetical protein